MPARDVLVYPDPFLRVKCRLVEPAELATSEMQSLLADLVETLYAQPGAVGLAASQVGEPIQVLVMDETARTTREKLRVLVNPVLVQLSQWKLGREGCLSFPDHLASVKRARRVKAEWLDASGASVAEELFDFAAVILQHEVDHLHGILFIDRVRNLADDLMPRTRPITTGP